MEVHRYMCPIQFISIRKPPGSLVNSGYLGDFETLIEPIPVPYFPANSRNLDTIFVRILVLTLRAILHPHKADLLEKHKNLHLALSPFRALSLLSPWLPTLLSLTISLVL